MDAKKLKEVFSDKEFVERLGELDKPEDVQAELKKKGIDVSVEELIAFKDKLSKTGDQELSESELEDAAGGGDLWDIFQSVESITKKAIKAGW
jgi:predicted ribosomally synthesized peptide with nif11-like leader